MKMLLITSSAKLPTISRIYQESGPLKIEIDLFNPESFSLSLKGEKLSTFTNIYKNHTILNRYTSVSQMDLDLDIIAPLSGPYMINSIAGMRTCRSKFSQSLQIETNHVNSIPSLVTRGAPSHNKLVEELDHLDSPHFIAKPFRGNGGRGITLLESKRSALSFIETCFDINDQNFMIQPFLDVACETRLLMVNNKPLLIIEKTIEESDTSFKHNLSRDSEANIFDVNGSLEPHHEKYLNEAQNLSHQMDLRLCAIDFIKTKSDEHYFLEVNPVPGWAQIETKYNEVFQGRNLTREILEHIIK